MGLDLKEVLLSLDPKDDEFWTSDGKPKLSAISSVVGREVTRKEVTDAFPELTRETAGGIVPPAQVDEASVEEAVSAEIEKIDAAVADVSRQIAELERHKKELSRERAMLTIRLNGPVGKIKDNVAARMTYIRRQNELRAERVDRRNKILQHLDPQSLRSKSPLDEALGRKRDRGRPGFIASER